MAERYRTRGAAAAGCLHWAPADGADGYRRPIKKSRYKTIHHTRWRERGGAPPLLHSTIIPVSFFFFTTTTTSFTIFLDSLCHRETDPSTRWAFPSGATNTTQKSRAAPYSSIPFLPTDQVAKCCLCQKARAGMKERKRFPT